MQYYISRFNLFLRKGEQVCERIIIYLISVLEMYIFFLRLINIKSMDKTQIIIFCAVMVFLGFRIYQKYFKKDQANSGTEKKSSIDSSFSSTSKKDEEYEPYSKK
jgi:hypothetical protein